MAHGDQSIDTQRTIRLESLFEDHSNEGGNINVDAALRHDGLVWAVVRDAKDHGEFHLRHAEIRSWGLSLETSEPHGVLYRPIHASMTAEDIEGATYAHDDGTHWLFAHCSPHEQIDFAVAAATFAESQFATAIAKAQVKVAEATNAPLKASAVAKVSALVKFADAVAGDCHKRVVKAVLGHYHKNPHNDHRRDLVVAGIDAVLLAWQEAGVTDKAIRQDRSYVSTVASTVRSAMMATHTIEWRHERAARIEAEKKAAEAAAAAESSGSDGDSGSDNSDSSQESDSQGS